MWLLGRAATAAARRAFHVAVPIDPQTGHYFDDTRRYIEALNLLSPDDRAKVDERNARRVYARLDAALKTTNRS